MPPLGDIQKTRGVLINRLIRVVVKETVGISLPIKRLLDTELTEVEKKGGFFATLSVPNNTLVIGEKNWRCQVSAICGLYLTRFKGEMLLYFSLATISSKSKRI